MPKLDHTHDAKRRSWVVGADRMGTDFPLQNLPHGVFATTDGGRRGGVAIGDYILDITAALNAGMFDESVLEAAAAAAEPTLNRLMAMGPEAATKLRHALFDVLADNGAKAREAEATAATLLVPMVDARMVMPVDIGAFTDFMTSLYHVSAARAARPARDLAPAFAHLPIGYNSRATSVTEDGIAFPRPNGQARTNEGEVWFGPTRELDFELEFGAFIGVGNELGDRIAIADAEQHLFGYVLVNDWSARDIQRWEARLGPFLGKAFRTTISPWVVTGDALAPFRAAPLPRAEGLAAPLPYLDSEDHRRDGALDVSLKAGIRTAQMRNAGETPFEIVDTRLLHCSWTLPQMLVHHTSGGCNMRPGDLISSGTASGPDDPSAACLLERTAGHLALELPNGEQRVWLEDGDEVIFTARAERDGFVGIGFGTCGAEVLPAR